MSKYVVEW